MVVSVFIIMIVPVILGVMGAVLPAFGFFPPLGGEALSLQPFVDFFALPGIHRAILLSLMTGLVATVLSCGLALILPGL